MGSTGIVKVGAFRCARRSPKHVAPPARCKHNRFEPRSTTVTARRRHHCVMRCCVRGHNGKSNSLTVVCVCACVSRELKPLSAIPFCLNFRLSKQRVGNRFHTPRRGLFSQRARRGQNEVDSWEEGGACVLHGEVRRARRGLCLDICVPVRLLVLSLK
jgi:hypothetical protein